MTARLGLGVYSLSEAARLTGLRPITVRDWFLGRKSESRKPVFEGEYDEYSGHHFISFHDLIDVVIAGQLRQHGVRLPVIRRVYGRLQKEFGERHPFCLRKLETDGREVFLRLKDKDGIDQLVEVLTKQRVFPEIIAPFLKQIDYDTASSLAKRWRIDSGVVVDPAVSLGKPIVERVGIKTDLLVATYEANCRDEELVAWCYNVAVEDVRAAVRFEARLAV
jgi:uncharacterized protein (DUF433 family)